MNHSSDTDKTLLISNFNVSLRSYNQSINIDTLVKNFKLDVYMNENNTMLLQDGQPVSKNNLTMRKKENKRKHFNRPVGFVQLQYVDEKKLSDRFAESSTFLSNHKMINNPPIGPILNGAWCSSCLNVGPTFHKMNCREPHKLCFTLYGVIQYIFENEKLEESDLQDHLRERVKRMININRDFLKKEQYIQAYNDIRREHPELEKYHETLISAKEGEWPLLNVSVKKTEKVGFFPNCVNIKYNFDANNVSVRIYDNGTILFISCPWDQKGFFNEFLKRLNDTKSIVDVESENEQSVQNYEIDFSQTQVKSVFSIFHIGSDIDLDVLFHGVWPTDKLGNPVDSNSKITLTKQFENDEKTTKNHTYLKWNNLFYRYEVTYAPNKSKIIMKMLPTVLTEDSLMPMYCKPYKISVLIFKGGAVELIFSFCSSSKDADFFDSTEYIIPVTLEDQFNEIEKELVTAKGFLEGLFASFPGSITKDSSEIVRNISTVSGIIPYKKPLKYNENTKVDIFNEEKMEFDKIGTVRKKIDDVKYEVENEAGFISEIENKYLRPSDTQKMSVMQINHSNNQPVPYGFRSKCEAGNNYFVPFGGEQGRDNFYYPKCEKSTGSSRQLYLSHIVNGFPSNGEEENKFLISKTDEYDKFSGVFKTGAIKLFATIRFKLPENQDLLEDITNEAMEYFKENMDDEGYGRGTIINFKKTSGNKLDNYVIYSIKMQNGGIVYITGNEIHPSYKESRAWGGIDGDGEVQKQKLLTCTEKLGLSQSPFTTMRLEKELQTQVVKKLWDLVGENYFNENSHVALTPQTLIKFTKKPYMCLILPKGAKRALLMIYTLHGRTMSYIVDDTLTVMNIPFDPEVAITFGDSVVEGFIEKGPILHFYPTDCVYVGKKLVMDYFSTDSVRKSQMEELYEFYEKNEIKMENNIVENTEYGRFMYTILFSNILGSIPQLVNSLRTHNKIIIKNPYDYCAPKCVKENPEDLSERSLIGDLAEGLLKNVSEGPEHLCELLFIPQRGKSSNIRWAKVTNIPIVFQITNLSKTELSVGMDNKRFEPIGESPIAIKANMRNEMNKRPKQERYMRFYLNFMSNGQLNPEEPLLVDNINPYATSKDAFSYEKTDLIIKALLYPVPLSMFKNKTNWKLVTNTPDFKKIFSIHLEQNETDPGTTPLRLL